MAQGSPAGRKNTRWFLGLSLVLVTASALTYFLHYLIFRDIRHIFLYMIGDFGFLFLDLLLVILLIERLLARREKRLILQKLNMVIGTFFSEVGLELLTRFSRYSHDHSRLVAAADIRPDWGRQAFARARAEVRSIPADLRIAPGEFEDMKVFLSGRRDFLVRLLENPHLLEHERFTDLLRAVFHLCEELAFRRDGLAGLPASDFRHLTADVLRAYSLIIDEWLAYAEYLKESYPFLFSLAIRINPIGPHPSPIVMDPQPASTKSSF